MYSVVGTGVVDGSQARTPTRTPPVAQEVTANEAEAKEVGVGVQREGVAERSSSAPAVRYDSAIVEARYANTPGVPARPGNARQVAPFSSGWRRRDGSRPSAAECVEEAMKEAEILRVQKSGVGRRRRLRAFRKVKEERGRNRNAWGLPRGEARGGHAECKCPLSRSLMAGMRVHS